jgi:hypothetical protein
VSAAPPIGRRNRRFGTRNSGVGHRFARRLRYRRGRHGVGTDTPGKSIGRSAVGPERPGGVALQSAASALTLVTSIEGLLWLEQPPRRDEAQRTPQDLDAHIA